MAGLVMVGVSGYGFLVLSTRALGPVRAAPLSVLWTLVNTVGAGLFVPFEQELGHRAAAARVRGEDIRGLVVRSSQCCTGLLLALALGSALFAGPIVDRVLGGHRALLGCVLLTCAAFAAQHLTRGVLAATGRFGAYGRQLLLDGALRLGGALLVAWWVGWSGSTGGGAVVAFGAVVVAAPTLSLVGSARAVRRYSGPGPEVRWRDVLPGLGLVGLGQALSIVLIGAGPVMAVVLAGEEQPLATGLLVGVLLLARAPLLAFYAVQATLLPGLAALIAGGRGDRARRRALLTLAAAAGLGALGTAAAWALGPLVVRILLGPDFDLGALPVAAALGGTALFVVASVAAQSALAFDAHRWFAASWAAALTSYAAVLMLPMAVVPRVLTALVVGTAVAAVLATTGLLRSMRREGVRPSG